MQMRMGMGLGARPVVQGFFPASLFSSGAAGAWYDPSDFSTLYQTSTGTTPVTAVEQPVGLMLDRSRGLVLGSELVTINSATLTGSTGYTAITGASCVAGRSYSVSYTCVLSGGTIQGVVGGTALTSTSVSGTFSFIVVATSSVAPQFYSSAGVGSISNYSVRELPGNHASQATSASRPVLRSRYNLLTRSEEFDVSPWSPDNSGAGSTNPVVTANYGTAPNGTTTADRIQFTRGATGFSRIQQGVVVPAATYTYSVWLRNTSGSGASVSLRLDGTQGEMITLTEAWQRVSITISYAGGTLNSQILIWSNISGSPLTADILAWGASLLTSADQTSTGGAYQRIAAATDYDTSNPVWRPYLAFDGTDDSFGTSAIDFSATDEMTVFAGVHKASDAARATLAELGNNVTSSFRFEAPNAATPTYQFASAGTNLVGTTTSSVYAAPTTNVLTGIGDISADVATLRVNGAPASSNTADQGTGNYGNHALFIGARNNASQRLNGRLYALAVLGRTATAAEISAMEAWVAGKTGVTI
jgi:hypothetical protein